MTNRLSAAAILAAATLASSAAGAQERIKFEMWYGLTGQLGERTAETCKRFNESQTKYEAVCVGQGGYDKAEQNTIAAYRSKQHPTVVQIYDAGTVNFMLSGAVKPAVTFAKEHAMKLILLRDLDRGDVVFPLQLLDRASLLEQGCLREDQQDQGAGDDRRMVR
jgi:sn-glycerol 3-phosphate transport system substrate-binding protein